MSRRERRAHRARRGRTLGVVGVAVAILLVVVVAVVATRGGSDDDGAVQTPTRAVTSTTTTSPPVTTTVPVATTEVPVPPTAAAGPPYAVETVQTTVVDPTRGTEARGPTPASGSRTLPLTVHVPSGPGPFPLVVFAHGYDIAAADYADFQRDLAAQGFVVVAPDFPRSSAAFPGPPTQDDIDEQARDVGFVVDQMLDGKVSGSWSGKIRAGEAGVVGHSDGGNTAARVAGNSCCMAPRIGAAAVLSGDEGTSGGQWGVAGSPPMLFVQGTADSINPWSFTQRLYDDAASPKTLVAIDGAGHLEPYTTGPQRGAIVDLVAAFLQAHLTGDAAAAGRVATLADVGDLRLVSSS